jgi:hypothetical protein
MVSSSILLFHAKYSGPEREGAMEVTRRDLFKRSAALIMAASASRVISAADDPLPSWNDGSSKKAILDFVSATIDRVSPKFVPEPERIVTFDQDGNLVGRASDVHASCLLP